MKTFDDIEFKEHPAGDGFHGKIFFDNGYGVSVVRFKPPLGLFPDISYFSYTNNDDEWELAVLFGNENLWEITYNTPITDNVIGHLSSDGVTDIMKKVQEL
jgi:hypothetical protein